MSEKLDRVSLGARDAWDFWLSQHDYSVPETIEQAIRDTFAAWLNEHSDEIVQAIANRSKE